MIYIYGLIDPRNDNVRYIGKTNNLNSRYRHEICTAKREPNKCYRNSWIKNLLDNNFKPMQFLIDVVPLKEWQFWEKHYISLYKSWGFNLTNHSNGGYGNDSVSNFTRDKISKALIGNINKKGKKLNEEQKYNCGNGRRGKEASENQIKAVSKPVLQYTKDGTFIKEWPSGVKASEELGIHQATISAICLSRGYRKTAKGFKFKYK